MTWTDQLALLRILQKAVLETHHDDVTAGQQRALVHCSEKLLQASNLLALVIADAFEKADTQPAAPYDMIEGYRGRK